MTASVTGQDRHVWDLRRAFLEALRSRWWSREARDAFPLPEELPHLDRAGACLGALARSLPRVRRGDDEAAEREAARWATEHHLGAPWVIEAAGRTLSRWARIPGAVRRRPWFFPPLRAYEPVLWTFQALPWDLASESAPAAETRILSELKGQLRERIDKAKAERTFTTPRHVVWTVRASVLAEPWRQIASGPIATTPESVRAAVRELCDAMGLPIPRFRGGRPSRR